jgi:hypothetical protein
MGYETFLDFGNGECGFALDYEERYKHLFFLRTIEFGRIKPEMMLADYLSTGKFTCIPYHYKTIQDAENSITSFFKSYFSENYSLEVDSIDYSSPLFLESETKEEIEALKTYKEEILTRLRNQDGVRQGTFIIYTDG